MTKLYDVILADPPWTFSVWNAEKSDRHASHKYNLMSVEDICAMPIANVITENCTLFLWATWPNLKDAFTVITAWGFTYRTVAWVWVKLNENSMGTHIGMSYYTRSNTEPSLAWLFAEQCLWQPTMFKHLSCHLSATIPASQMSNTLK